MKSHFHNEREIAFYLLILGGVLLLFLSCAKHSDLTFPTEEELIEKAEPSSSEAGTSSSSSRTVSASSSSEKASSSSLENVNGSSSGNTGSSSSGNLSSSNSGGASSSTSIAPSSSSAISSSSSWTADYTYNNCNEGRDASPEFEIKGQGTKTIKLSCSGKPKTNPPDLPEDVGYYIQCVPPQPNTFVPNSHTFTISVPNSSGVRKNESDNGYNLPNTDNSGDDNYYEQIGSIPPRWHYTKPISITPAGGSGASFPLNFKCRIWR